MMTFILHQWINSMSKNITYNPSLKSDVRHVFQLTQELNTILAKAYTNGTIASVICGKANAIGNKNKNAEWIDVELLVEKEALICATEAYSDYHVKSGFPTKASRRTVGYMHLYPTAIAQSIEDKVREINSAKLKVEKFVHRNFQTQNDRYKALREASNGLITLHLYRQIRCLSEQNIIKIGFAWSNKQSVTKVVKTELLSMLTKQIQAEIDLGNSEVGHLSNLINTVSNVPEELLRLVRPIQVQPVANFVTETHSKTITASLPIIIIQKEKPKVILPKNYNAEHANKHKKRTDSHKREHIGFLRGYKIEALPS